MTDYTPTLEEVRMAYGDVHCFDPDAPHDHVCPADHAFDRWLAAHDAQKRAEWEAEQGERRPCRLPHTAPPCTTCQCGARVTWDAARERTERLAEQAEIWLPVDENGGGS